MDDHGSASMIESPREAELREARERAAELLAAQSDAERRQREAEQRKKVLRIVIFVVGGILAAGLVVALTWLIITIVGAARTPAGEVGGGEEAPMAELPVIVGYQCTTDQCSKMTDLPDGRMVMRDGAYYIYDMDTKVVVKTTIPERAYHAIIPFTWGEEVLAVLDPDTGWSALYSITRNQQVASFDYDEFIMDAGAADYVGMEWIVGKYILAKRDGAVRLLDVFDGAEVVRAQNKIFAYGAFFFGYDGDGARRVYMADGTRVLVAAQGDQLFVKDGRLIVVTAAGSTTFKVYSEGGVELTNGDEYYMGLRDALAGQRDYAAAIGGMAGVYKVA